MHNKIPYINFRLKTCGRKNVSTQNLDPQVWLPGIHNKKDLLDVIKITIESTFKLKNDLGLFMQTLYNQMRS